MSRSKPARHRQVGANFTTSLNTPRTIRRSDANHPKSKRFHIWFGVSIFLGCGLIAIVGNHDRYKPAPSQQSPHFPAQPLSFPDQTVRRLSAAEVSEIDAPPR